MVFKFNDKTKAIKPLGIIIETYINSPIKCMFIKQSVGNLLSIDILYYSDIKTLNNDVNNLYRKLNEFYKSEEEKKARIGFVPAVGDDDGHEPETTDDQEDE